MRIERRYTKDGQSRLRGHRVPADHQRDPQSGRLGGVPARQCRGAGDLVAGRLRRAGAEVFPQGRRARAPEEGRGEDRPLLAVALGRRRGGARRAAREGAHHRRAIRQAGVRPAGRHLDLLGLEGRLFRQRGRRARLLRRAALHAGDADVRAQLAAMVQHRPALGLRHRRPEPGPLLRRLQDRQADQARRPPTSIRSRTPASSSRSPTTSSTKAASWTCGCARRACSNTAPAPAPTSRALRGEGERLVRRRQVVGPDELPQDRRPRGRRHQVGRHHAPRRQDGDRRRRPSRHRAVHRLEGDARSRRSPASSPAPRSTRSTCKRDPQGLRQLRGLGRRLLRAGEEPGAEARDQARAPRPTCPTTHPARDPVRASQGYTDIDFPIYDTDWDSEAYLTVSGPELQQLGARHRRVPQGRRGRRRLGPDLAHQARQGRQDR